MLILFVEGNFFVEVFIDIFAVFNHNEEILPEMEIVFHEVEYFLLTWIFFVFLHQESNELRTIIIRIINIVFAVASDCNVLSNVEFFLLFCDFVTVFGKILDFLIQKCL
mgnify:CR=1 FL=1